MEASVSTVVVPALCYIASSRLLFSPNSEEEDPDEYPFPLTLRAKNKTASGSSTPGTLDGATESLNAVAAAAGIGNGVKVNGGSA